MVGGGREAQVSGEPTEEAGLSSRAPRGMECRPMTELEVGMTSIGGGMEVDRLGGTDEPRTRGRDNLPLLDSTS